MAVLSHPVNPLPLVSPAHIPFGWTCASEESLALEGHRVWALDLDSEVTLLLLLLLLLNHFSRV